MLIPDGVSKLSLVNFESNFESLREINVIYNEDK